MHNDFLNLALKWFVVINELLWLIKIMYAAKFEDWELRVKLGVFFVFMQFIYMLIILQVIGFINII
jgi:hypothetical protein